ncbi:T9SS type A sorting domain-containing protein [Flavisolibacter ginsenosidimutans]|uniref:T9SS type A sorting domain-containing protein n=2 Tax=Flavisolibacter ginsenosidimutans TaxID=661481 RepID=A0A5B8UPH7_9BACT|nr:T9SS type A sorting domain-containing protein [Flavisolibacter ginsenosidimutans]
MPTNPASPSPVNNASNLFLSGNTVNLTWASNYADNYSIYFGTSSDNLTKLAEIPATSSSYTSPVLSPNTKYYWRVDATNVNGTTTGSVWNFKTANVPITVAGDYRTKASGNWGSGSVTTAIWEVFDGTSWNATSTLPSSSTPTVSIRTGHTVRLNATTSANNVVVESGATLLSGTTTGASGTATVQNLRIANSVNNFGAVGSSSTSTDRVNFEATRNNGTIYVTGTSTYYLNTFSVHTMAQNLEIVVDANLNLTSYLRAFSTTSPSDNSQNDDNVTVTINEGKTVTMGSSGYLHIQSSGNTNATNTISSFGNYTYNINGTLDMRSTGTTAIVAHSTRASVITINTNGTWMLGNAMRLVPATGSSPVGTLNLNIGPNGVVDAGARTISSSNTATNLVVTNSSMPLTVFFNIGGGGLLKSKVANSEVLYPIGSGGTYSPVKLNNSGTADIVGVGVATGFDKPVTNATRMVNKQYSIVPTTTGVAKLDVSLGWITADQGSNFDLSLPTPQARYNTNSWVETPSTLSGAGTVPNPYYVKVSGYTAFGSFAVTNPAVPPVVVTKNFTTNLNEMGSVTITPANIDNGSSDDYAIASMSLDKTTFDCSNVGENTVTLTVTDIHGNQATGTATVFVKDLTPPTAATKNITVNLTGGTATISAADVNNGSADACGIKAISLDKTSFDCSNVGENAVTLTVTDVHGNQASGTAIVVVKDVTLPSVITKNITVNLSSDGKATIAAADVNNGSSDDCGIQSVNLDKSSFDCSNVGENTVVLTVTDTHGNQATGTATVTVKDVTAPTVVTKNITVNLSGGKATITAADIDNGSADACGIKSMSIDKTSFTCASIGTHEVTLTVTDAHNNTANAKAVVTIVGAIPQPGIVVSRNDQTYTGGSATTVFLGYGAQKLNFTATDATSTSSEFSWTPSASLSVTNNASTIFAPSSAGNYPYSVTATNEYGCSASASIVATVFDVRCGTKMDKVILCHKGGKELCIGYEGVQDHLAHGDKLGSCVSPSITSRTVAEPTVVNYESDLFVSPNPATSGTNVSFTLPQAGKYKLELFNVNGVRVKLLQEAVSKVGQNIYKLDASTLTPGLYLIRLTTTDVSLSKQLIVQ